MSVEKSLGPRHHGAPHVYSDVSSSKGSKR
jgi:hypothetical protein